MVARLVVRQFVVLLLASLVVLYSHASSEQETIKTDYEDDHLSAMTNAELELICTELGFALQKDVVDEATGELKVFSHEDYVEAARQCLSIEKELQEVLSEHPEILEELEAERASMMQEKERLEQELKDTKLAHATAIGQGNETKSLPAAFIPSSTVINNDTTATTDTPTTTDTNSSNDTIVETVDAISPTNLDAQDAVETTTAPQTLVQVLDELFLGPLPPAVKDIVRQVLSKMKEDVEVAVHLIQRYVTPLIGQLFSTIRLLLDKKKDDGESPKDGQNTLSEGTESIAVVDENEL